LGEGDAGAGWRVINHSSRAAGKQKSKIANRFVLGQRKLIAGAMFSPPNGRTHHRWERSRRIASGKAQFNRHKTRFQQGEGQRGTKRENTQQRNQPKTKQP